MNCFMTACIDAGADSGYIAAMLWSIVHVERPSSSTSGGQSGGTGVGSTVVVVAAAVDAEAGFVDFFIIAIHAELAVQLRQLLIVNAIPHSK